MSDTFQSRFQKALTETEGSPQDTRKHVRWVHEKLRSTYDMTVPTAMIRKWKAGREIPSEKEMRALSHLLGVTSRWLSQGSDTTETNPADGEISSESIELKLGMLAGAIENLAAQLDPPQDSNAPEQSEVIRIALEDVRARQAIVEGLLWAVSNSVEGLRADLKALKLAPNLTVLPEV